MKKLAVSNLYKYVSTGAIQLFPNGKEFLFVKKQMEKKSNEYISSIWAMETNGRNLRQLTFGKGDNQPKISPNGEKIAFVSKRKKDKKGSELYVLPMKGGEARLIKTVPGGISQLEWQNNENLGIIYFKNPDNKETTKEPPEEKIYEIEKIPFLSNGSGFTEGRVGRAAIISTKSGKMADIKINSGTIQYMRFSPDGKKVLLIKTDAPEKKPQWSSLYIKEIKGKKEEKISSETTSVYFADWKDNESVYMLCTNYERGFASTSFVDILDVNTKKRKTVIDKSSEISFRNTLNSDVRGVGGTQMKVKDGKLYFLETNRYKTVLKSVDESGNITTIVDNGESIDSFDLVTGDSVIFNSMNFTNPLEIFSSKKQKLKKLTSVNNWIKNHTISKPEQIEFSASDGTLIDGWIMKPADFSENLQYPGILEIHGGPRTAYGNAFIHEFQILAASGYSVMFCNPRGSDGYSSEFADIRAHYGERDFEDLMEFIEYIDNNFDFVDSERLGVTGGSYGGFMTNWIIGHTDTFKAAVSQRSISNWVSFFGTTDIGYYFAEDQTGGNFWENMDNYIRQSPLFYAPNVETPTMFIHSLEDYRCWVPEAMQFFTALRYLGKEAKLVLFPKENHELSRGGLPVHREKRLNCILQWFDKHLKTEK